MRSAHLLASSLLAAMAPLAASQSNADDPGAREYALTVAKIAADYLNLAGSEDNAVALAESLHEGVPVRLIAPSAANDEAVPAVTLMEPPTGPMDWSDVRMALMLARDALVSVGIYRPAAEQLRAVLTGGEFVTPSGRLAAFRGVLQMRAEGLNWGRIASQRFQRRAVARIEP
jgi:hypothetical protein